MSVVGGNWAMLGQGVCHVSGKTEKDGGFIMPLGTAHNVLIIYFWNSPLIFFWTKAD